LNTLIRAEEIIENLRSSITSQEFRSAFFENKIALYSELIDLYYKKGMRKRHLNMQKNQNQGLFWI